MDSKTHENLKYENYSDHVAGDGIKETETDTSFLTDRIPCFFVYVFWVF